MKNTSFLTIFSTLLLCCSLSLAVRSPDLTAPPPRALHAASLIRALNLTPKEANVVNNDIRGSEDLDHEIIVEKSFAFPGLSTNVSAGDLGHHAGYYKLPHSHGGRLFYFFFESRHNKSDAPVVIWLTGGPGCSSELALFYENGPYTIDDNLSLVRNDFGWDQASNIVYVDQPVGTGFSYTNDSRDIRRDETGVSNDLYDFLQAFFAKHRRYVKNEFYITGESYAGHYIPALASRIHQGNKAKQGIHINMKGFAIGNGLTNPGIQYAAYADFALENGLISQADYNGLNRSVGSCLNSIRLCEFSAQYCMEGYDICNALSSSILRMAGGNINVYDIRKQCVGALCYDFSNMEKFLSEKSVLEALGVGDDIEFASCSAVVHVAMNSDWMKNLEVGIPALLEHGIKVLIYTGEYDYICNWLGNWRWVHAMKWSGQRKFKLSPEVSFNVDGVEAGKLKKHGPLSFLKVHDAGHMVPMDQPKAALAMLKRWTRGKLH